MRLWRTIYHPGEQFTARSAPALFQTSRRTDQSSQRAPQVIRNRERERGSALLIVFLFAAFVAIMLYKEMPDVLFEAQRQKEQVLIDRGDEYKHAIKLFYVHNSAYPTSLDQLDKFNNIRYIRHRFKDPMTGKDEWRLIHISGPGFNLTDSKVTQPKTQLGQNGTSVFGSSSTSSAFGSQRTSNSFGSPDSGTPSSPEDTQSGSEQPGGAEAAALARRRPPEAPANTFGAAPQRGSDENANDENANNDENADEGETQPMPGSGLNGRQPGNPMGGGVPAPNGMLPYGANPASANAVSENGTAAAMQPPGMQPQSRQPQGMQPQGMQPQGMQPQGMQPQGMQPQGAQPRSPQPQSAQSAGLAAVNNALRQPGPTRTTGTSSMGTMFAAGSIAGVASKAKGKSIKVMDKQTDYSKWEFVYNPQKEMAQKMNSSLPSPTNGQNASHNGFFSPANGTSPNPSTSTNNPAQ